MSAVPPLAENLTHLAGPHHFQRRQNSPNKRAQVNHAIRACAKQEYCPLKLRNVLLEFEVTIHRHEYFKASLRAAQ